MAVREIKAGGKDNIVKTKTEKQYKSYCRNHRSHSNFHVRDW